MGGEVVRRGRAPWWRFGLASALVLASCVAYAQAAAGDGARITALGRIEPKGGPLRVAGPSGPAPVIVELRVDEGDRVDEGEILAVLDRHALLSAMVKERSAELRSAERERDRARTLMTRRAGAEFDFQQASDAAEMASARLAAARAERELALVRAPIAGQVLVVHARAGERVGPEGILELGRTDQMYAVAEVYETDVRLVQPGQRAIVTSPALPEPVEGEVEHIGLRIGKADVLGTDPMAKVDSRVVEVEIRLFDAVAVAGLTHLNVDVEIETAPRRAEASP